MANVYLQDSTLTAIGNAIRSKTGESELLLPSAMAAAIQGISGVVSEDSQLEVVYSKISSDVYVPYSAFGCSSNTDFNNRALLVFASDLAQETGASLYVMTKNVYNIPSAGIISGKIDNKNITARRCWLLSKSSNNTTKIDSSITPTTGGYYRATNGITWLKGPDQTSAFAPHPSGTLLLTILKKAV